MSGGDEQIEAFTAEEPRVLDWLRAVAFTTSTFFPMPVQGGATRFELLSPARELSFGGYRPSVVPPGKKLSPAREQLFSFERGGDGRLRILPSLDEEVRVLAGVRPCDLRAVHLMDGVWLDGDPDPHYQARRRNTAIIAYACPHPCDESCFCDSVGSLDHRQGADVVLTPVGDLVLIEALTERGVELLEGAGFEACADAPALRQRHRDDRPQPFGRSLSAPPADVRDLLARTWDSPAWEKHTERCQACGTCNLVCPTCYCFDVFDEQELASPGEGARYRTWDGCMLPEFATVAGGHDFRPGLVDKQRHRVKRKFEYLSVRNSEGSYCVGCGRCGTQCTADIDIFDIVQDLLAEEVTS